MGNIARIGTPSDKDIRHIYSHMRKIDRIECRAMSGLSPKKAVLAGVKLSDEVRCGYVNDEPVSIYGYGAGTIWMLGTPNIRKAPVALMKESYVFIRHALQQYETLINFVDAKNIITLHWLRRLGFVIINPPQRMGREMRLVHMVYIQKGTLKHV